MKNQRGRGGMRGGGRGGRGRGGSRGRGRGGKMGGDNEDGEGMMYGGGGDEMEVSQRQSSSGPRCTDHFTLFINDTGVLAKLYCFGKVYCFVSELFLTQLMLCSSMEMMTMTTWVKMTMMNTLSTGSPKTVEGVSWLSECEGLPLLFILHNT